MIICSCIQSRKFLKEFPHCRKTGTEPQRNMGHQLANQRKHNERTSSLICLLSFTLKPLSSFQPFLKKYLSDPIPPSSPSGIPIMRHVYMFNSVPDFSESFSSFFSLFFRLHNLYYPSSSLLSAHIDC